MKKVLVWVLVLLLLVSNTTGFMGLSFAEEVLAPVSDEPAQQTETPVIQEIPAADESKSPETEPEALLPALAPEPPADPIVEPEPEALLSVFAPEPPADPIVEPEPILLPEPSPVLSIQTEPLNGSPEVISESLPAEDNLNKAAPKEVKALQKKTAPDVSALALSQTPGNYAINPGWQIVTLEDDSTNAHTFAYMLWVYNDIVHVAVSSTHGTDYMIFDGVTNQAANKDEYAPLVDIVIDGTSYDPAVGVNGNTKDAQWTVYKYPLSSIVVRDNEEVSYSIDSYVGGGHDITSTLTMVVPKVDLTVTKEWNGGANLSVYIDVKNTTAATGTNVFSTQNLIRENTGITSASETIKVPTLSPYGAPYTYSVEEKPVPTGYDVVYTGSNYSFTVTNTYNPLPATVNLSGSKALSGRALTDEAFSFTVHGSDESGVPYGDALQTVKNVGTNFTFEALTYEDGEEGTYYYVIREVNGGESGMTYDDTAFLVTVEVTDDGSGQLSANVSYKVVGGDTVTGVEFTNSYEASGSWTPMFTKSLSGRLLKDKEFSFEVREGDNMKSTGKNNAAGSITFSTINYTQADVGLHTYTVHEVVPATPESGMTYDAVAKTVTVNVVDAGGGVLTVTTTYPEDVTFNNSYVASGEVILEASKVLTGRVLAAGEFSFTLHEGETLLQTKMNALNGDVVFDALSFDQEDIGKSFTYTVKEVPGALYATTYDTQSYTVIISVSDAGNGELAFDIDTDDMDLIFTNVFSIPEIDIPVQKVWSGDLGAAAVEIELLADGVPTGIVLKLEAANTWKGLFEDMDVAKVDGTPIVYTVRENTVLTGYTTSITGDKTLGFVVTNVQDPIILPNIPLTVTKKWVGGTGPSVVIEFYADGVWLKDQNVTLSASNNWTGRIEVPATDEDGKTIVYTIKEKAVSGYTAKITGDVAGGFTVTNTKNPVVLPETGVGSNLLIFTFGMVMGLLGLYLVVKHKESSTKNE